MNKNLKIALIIVATAIVIYFAYRYFFKKEETAVLDTDGKITKADAGKENATDQNFPLDKGMIGPNIRRLQTALNFIKPTNNLQVDGNFGSKTYAAFVTTLPTYLTALPIDEQKFNDIIKLGNAAATKKA